MLSAVVAVCGIMDREDFVNYMQASFAHKFARKPEVIDGNMKALQMAWDAAETPAEQDARIA